MSNQYAQPQPGLCRYFAATGTCFYGDHCNFSHVLPSASQQQQQQQQPSSGAQQQAQAQQQKGGEEPKAAADEAEAEGEEDWEAMLEKEEAAAKSPEPESWEEAADGQSSSGTSPAPEEPAAAEPEAPKAPKAVEKVEKAMAKLSVAETSKGKEEEEQQQQEQEKDVTEGKPLRSPICCVLGHVDVGKTKLLDKIRRTNVQDGEAGGITQQIGASYFPTETIQNTCRALGDKLKLNYRVPGLLIIDTPGHESFTNLRARGSSLCDIAVLVVDLMHSLEPQTIESINLLRQRKTPFVVALNKVDRLYNWSPTPGAPFRDSLKRQSSDVRIEFEQRTQEVINAFAGEGLNAALYYKSPDYRKYVMLVPTSAHTGEGIPDLLLVVIQLTQKCMSERLLYLEGRLQATVLEVKVVEGLGTCLDVILVNGRLNEGDTIVLCGLNGPIVTQIRALLAPQPLRELRVKCPYTVQKTVQAAQGIRISAQNLEEAVAGSSLLVAGPGDDIEDLKDEVQQDLKSMTASVDKSGVGVCVQASTLGSLEALLVFLKESKIPVSGINIGPVHRKDIVRASVMLDKPHTKKYAVILAFDVKVEAAASEMAETMGVRVFTADIIYHLFDQFTAYVKECEAAERAALEKQGEAIWPVALEILPMYVFNKRDPIIVGCRVTEGSLRLGTPICVPSREGIVLGRVVSIEANKKTIELAKKGDEVAVKIQQGPSEQAYLYGRHFDHKDELVSRITRDSLDRLKAQFREQVTQEDVILLKRLKDIFKI